MIITVASFKGGVGKTTTAVHLATYFSKLASTLLIDGDPNRSASGWAKRGKLPFSVIDERQAAKYARQYEHIVIDTQARPEMEDLEALVEGCDLLIIPCTPDALALDAMMLTVKSLKQLGSESYKILLTIIPPKPSRDGEEARVMLTEAGLPLFKRGIRRYVAFQKAALAGIPVFETNDKQGKIAWTDYQAVGKEIIK
ncbi:ParA family protein [Cyanobacterium aponinum]|uniref:AAA family ATPase n=1 Tax=Cyanobacterium aponinum 0216 TaxID=2676140 RepID=A0A844GZ37_9CHRO|nr:ParA family protein [Cyanobacterium aponinum]MTF40322.1 AAA family ATPase [Cyanobacterium aponinum 0216]